MGGKFFRNHINFHHAHYSKDHLVSRTYLGDEGNNTPFFFIPMFLVGACTYLVLPVDLFVAQLVACAASFYAETDVGIGVSMTLHESNHGTQNGKNRPVH